MSVLVKLSWSLSHPLFIVYMSDPAAYLQAALKDGYFPHKNDLFLIHGPGGVGKSSLIAMFLGQQRDLNRASTAVAEESLHLSPVRDVSTSMFTDKWELVDIDRQARMVAHTSHHLLTSEGVPKVEIDANSKTEGSELTTEGSEATTRRNLFSLSYLLLLHGQPF